MLHDSDFIPYLLSTSESMVKWNLKNKRMSAQNWYLVHQSVVLITQFVNVCSSCETEMILITGKKLVYVTQTSFWWMLIISKSRL